MDVEEGILVTEGHRPGHAKEGEDAWVLRLLGFRAEDQVRLIGFRKETVLLSRGIQDGERFEIDLPHSRVTALSAWMRLRQGNLPEEPSVGCAIAIMSPSRMTLLCQRKDNKHPTPGCRGKLCLFGGSSQRGESPKETALRELYEELRNTVVADEIARQMRFQGRYTLPGVQWPGTYTCDFWLAVAPHRDDFTRWKASVLDPDGLAESDPVVIEWGQLESMIWTETMSPGSKFVGSHHYLLDRVTTVDRH